MLLSLRLTILIHISSAQRFFAICLGQGLGSCSISVLSRRYASRVSSQSRLKRSCAN